MCVVGVFMRKVESVLTPLNAITPRDECLATLIAAKENVREDCRLKLKSLKLLAAQLRGAQEAKQKAAKLVENIEKDVADQAKLMEAKINLGKLRQEAKAELEEQQRQEAESELQIAPMDNEREVLRAAAGLEQALVRDGLVVRRRRSTPRLSGMQAFTCSSHSAQADSHGDNGAEHAQCSKGRAAANAFETAETL